MKSFGIFLAAVVAIIIVAFAFGWIAAPFGVMSAGNVREQFRSAYENDASLKATAANICAAEKAVTAAEDSNEKAQRRSQVMAYEQNYQRISADYNAKMRDAFAAKYTKPGDLPDTARTLDDAKREICHN